AEANLALGEDPRQEHLAVLLDHSAHAQAFDYLGADADNVHALCLPLPRVTRQNHCDRSEEQIPRQFKETVIPGGDDPMSELSPSQQAYLEEQIARHGLEAVAGDIRSLARVAIHLATAGPDDYGRTGNTRLGGVPDLPEGMAWPTVGQRKG